MKPDLRARRRRSLQAVSATALAAATFLLPACTLDASQAQAEAINQRLPEDEIIYFVMPDRFENGDTANDRGGLDGTRLEHGFDPTDNGFFHGGDLAGLTQQLDYIQGLGATAVWLTPVFQNKAVQGPDGAQSAGYHGYWITDFTNVDPHIGTRDDFRAFVDAAHARGMKVYMDIITNHTADVIQYAECHGPDARANLRDCPYRPLGEYPYSTRGGIDGAPLNEGFLGDAPEVQTEENFARLTDAGYAYEPFIPAEEQDIKIPDWLNDPIYYHNRGNTTFEGENSLYGDFAGLDDLFTEHPAVVAGMIDIYKQWITDYRVDGFRIDTTRHVNPAFWQEVIPALEDHAQAEGIGHFHIFGEVYEFDPGQLAVFTRRDGLPTVLDFGFQGAVRGFVIDGNPGEALARFFNADVLYGPGAAEGRRLPTFLGNHDMGRFAGMLKESLSDAPEAELMARFELAHAMMMFSRGVPTIYYGDEQGFVSDGGDRGARENMFESRVPDYNDNDLLGTDATTAMRNFDREHPFYRAIAGLAALRRDHPALRRGEQRVRLADLEDSTFVMSRFSPAGDAEYVVAFNAETSDRTLDFAVDGRAATWQALAGDCPATSPAPGVLRLSVPALGYVVCKSDLGE